MKSPYQIASEIVDAWPYSVKVKASHKMLLVAMIAEEFVKKRAEGYRAGYENAPSVIADKIRARWKKKEETK